MPISVDGYEIRDLSSETWDDWVDLAERKNGMFGDCYCAYFHLLPDPPERKELGTKEWKHSLVAAGRSHAALVYDGEQAVAWAQYGPVAELPNIHHRKQWEKETTTVPDWRITCLIVDKAHRGTGLAAVAVRGALELIARKGGGLVEAYPHDLSSGKQMRSTFLYNATRSMYERLGFTYVRSKGQFNCVMTYEVAAAGSARAT